MGLGISWQAVEDANLTDVWGSVSLVAADSLCMAYLEKGWLTTTQKIRFAQCLDLVNGRWSPQYAADPNGTVFTSNTTPSLAVIGGSVVMAWRQIDGTVAWSVYDEQAACWSFATVAQFQMQPFTTSMAPAISDYMGGLFLLFAADNGLNYSSLPAGESDWTAPGQIYLSRSVAP
jgi:hypothetical protein